MLSKYNNDKGAALTLVVVMLLLLSVISVTVLVIAHSGAQQSAFNEGYERLYYESESVLNVADAIFTKKITIPTSEIKDTSDEAKQVLYDKLNDILTECKELAENEINLLYPDAEIEIEFTIDEHSIRTEKKKSNGSQWVSFFGGTNGSTINGNIVEVNPVKPFNYSIKLKSDNTASINRTVEVNRDYEVKGARYKPATSSGGGGYWLAGGNLVNSVANWTQWVNISCPQGLNIRDYQSTADSTMPYPSRNIPELMPTPINLGSEVSKIKNKAENIINSLPDSDVFKVTSWDPNPLTITPDMLRKPSGQGGGQYYTAIKSNAAGIELVGDFSSVGLKAVYGNGKIKNNGDYEGQVVKLGNSTTSFSCDKSSSTEPLYIFSYSTSFVTFSSECKISNVIMGTPNTITINGNTNANIYCDAQFYSNNAVNVGSDGSPLVVNNWNPASVPSFISSNVVNVYAKAQNGFSGIIYSQNNPNISIDAPLINGAFLLNGTSGMTLTNTSTYNQVQMYCEINDTAYANLNQTIKDYFDELVSREGGGGLSTDSDAEYIMYDDDDELIRIEDKKPATVYEVDY